MKNKQRHYKFIATVVRWSRKKVGNTYHSVRITRVKDGAMLFCHMTYGYDTQYKMTALQAMAKAKWLPAKYRQTTPPMNDDCMWYEKDHNYPISWLVTEGTRKACLDNGLDLLDLPPPL